MKVLSTTSSAFLRRHIWLMAFDVAQRHQRVRGRFDVHHARIFANGALDVLRVGSIDVGEFHSEICQHLIEEAGHASIKIVAADHVIARLVHGANGVDGSHSAGKDAGGNSAFEGRQVFFQTSARRVGNAGVFVTFVLAQFLLNVSGSGVDGNGDGAGFRVRFLAGVDGAGGKAWLFVFHAEAFSCQLSAISHEHLMCRVCIRDVGFGSQFLVLSSRFSVAWMAES